MGQYIYRWNPTMIRSNTVTEIIKLANKLAKNITPARKKNLREIKELKILNRDHRRSLSKKHCVEILP